jgi:hypothetical protein
MRQYEALLNKIAPLFYKFAQYHKFRNDNFYLIDRYLRSVKLPGMYHVDVLFSEKTYYFYYTGLLNFEGPTDITIVRLTTRNNVDIYSDSYMDEFIVNMVINGFSFENVNIATYGGNERSFISYKYLFIVLVGKDLYEALRASVK